MKYPPDEISLGRFAILLDVALVHGDWDDRPDSDFVCTEGTDKLRLTFRARNWLELARYADEHLWKRGYTLFSIRSQGPWHSHAVREYLKPVS